MDADILTTLLKAFIDAFSLGAARLIPDTLTLFRGLATIELMVLALWMVFGHLEQIGATLVTIALKITMYLWLITGWSQLTRVLVNGFIAYGLKGGGGDISVEDFTDPSKLAWFGITAMVPVFNRIFAYSGWDVVFNLHDILFTGIAALGVLIAFIWLAIEVFQTLLEFYALSAVVLVLIPFGILPYTTFLAEKAIAMVWAFAVKLLLLSFITGIGYTILRSPMLQPKMNPGFWECVTYAIAGWAMLGLAKKGPRVALGLLQGSPQLTAQDTMAVARWAMRTGVTIGASAWSAGAAAAAAASKRITTTTRRRA